MENKESVKVTPSKLSILVDRELYQKFKIKTISRGENITKVINKMIQDYVDQDK